MSAPTWLLLKWCFTSTETVGLLETGAQDGHLDFHTAPELCTNMVWTEELIFEAKTKHKQKKVVYFFCIDIYRTTKWSPQIETFVHYLRLDNNNNNFSSVLLYVHRDRTNY